MVKADVPWESLNEPSLTATAMSALMASAIVRPPSGGRVISIKNHTDVCLFGT